MLALYVPSQRPARHVAAVTELARERVLVGVRVLVPPQLRRAGEALGTEATGEFQCDGFAQLKAVLHCIVIRVLGQQVAVALVPAHETGAAHLALVPLFAD